MKVQNWDCEISLCHNAHWRQRNLNAGTQLQPFALSKHTKTVLKFTQHNTFFMHTNIPLAYSYKWRIFWSPCVISYNFYGCTSTISGLNIFLSKWAKSYTQTYRIFINFVTFPRVCSISMALHSKIFWFCALLWKGPFFFLKTWKLHTLQMPMLLVVEQYMTRGVASMINKGTKLELSSNAGMQHLSATKLGMLTEEVCTIFWSRNFFISNQQLSW